MRVVFDANVVVAGVCWQGEGWLCLVKLARRMAFAYGTPETIEETRETAVRLIRYLDRVRRVDPAPLGKRRSRDPKDDPYLAAALTAQVKVIVSHDHDLLTLEKPFGIQIVRPGKFLQMV